jgi:hypothetical protein
MHCWLDNHIIRTIEKINLGTEENLQHVKVIIDLELIINVQLVELLKEFKDIFA